MAQRTITSPGVEIRESDLSLITPLNIGTNFYVTGFAQKGPLDEVLKITSKQELDNIFGYPTSSPERYFYHTIDQLLNSPGNVYASRLPYGSDAGDGFGSVYSALVYPVRAVYDRTNAMIATGNGINGNYFESASARNVYTNNLDLSAATYVLGQPSHIDLTNEQYLSALDGSGFTWSSTADLGLSGGAAKEVSDFGGAGVVILNKAQTTINDQFEGYYVGLLDNTNLDPNSNFDGIRRIQSVNSGGTAGFAISGGQQGTAGTASSTTAGTYVTIPDGVLQFALSATPRGTQGSISEVMENLTDYDIDGRDDDDVLNVGVFKIRKSTYANEAFKLDYLLEDGIAGSINTYRTQLNDKGGPSIPFFLETRDSRSRNVEILVNPYISNYYRGTDSLQDGLPNKKIRLLTEQLVVNTDSAVTGISGGALGAGGAYGVTYGLGTAALSPFQTLTSYLGYADALYPIGAFNDQQVKAKIMGDIPAKLDRALDGIKNDEIYDIDVVTEGGLGTIYAASCASQVAYYDEFVNDINLVTAVNGLRTSNDITGEARTLRNNYSTIFNRFERFCSPPFLGGARGDCIFIADVLRHILVQGENIRTLDNKSRNFQKDIYWPMRHQFENENTSYAAVYGQWPLVYDETCGKQVYIPFSGIAGAAMAQTDANFFPWFAPAGFTRGLVRYANDIAVNPNQKQRDELYKANINPVAFFPSQGQVIFGQKTLSKKPSAFDRINVRRLFLSLERPTKKVSRFFVFEQNTEFTRQRIINVLTPMFERAKNNEGVYDYLIVCDERNNTPEVIDSNELVVDIYIKPVRTAEFILVNFIATRTDANFEEIIG